MSTEYLDYYGFCVYNADMKNKNEKRRGRPSKEKTKGVRLDMRLEELEKEAFSTAADLSGLDLSAWIRERLRKVAKSELEDAGQPVPFIVRKKS